jgi:RNA 3'-terminal phosphate cyclase (ATP)
MKFIDGSIGEGGGQILRTSLTLSLVTGAPLKIEKIRAGRKKPGLLRQHLTAVEAAAEVGRAAVRGAELGSKELQFEPREIAPGTYRFSVGTAGSTTLVLQTILPPLLTASGPSEIIIEGGTHNPMAPPFDFLEKSFLPLVSRIGPRVKARLERPGFFPAGGGRLSVKIEPSEKLARLDLLARGKVRRMSAKALVAKLPRHIAERELRVLAEELSLPDEALHAVEAMDSLGPGNAVTVEIVSEHLTEVFAGFGERGTPAEKVARKVACEVREYIEAGAPVGPHLADQLLILLALAGGGSFLTGALTPHATTNMDVIREFLEMDMRATQASDKTWQVQVGPEIS